MKQRFCHLRDDEHGMSMVFTAIGLMAFLAATTLSIDVGMFMAARSQAQNAADAGALAGATALVFNSWTDRSSTGPAVTSAVSASTSNNVVGTAPSVKTSDVTFPTDPTGLADRVSVTVYRTTARGNSVPTLMGALFGVNTVDIGATATAEASPANAMTCVKPFMIPDKWIEKVTANGVPDGPWTPSSTFDMYDKHGAPLATPDIYIDATHSDYTGYTVANDVGKQLVLRAGTGGNITPSFYYSWKMPGDTGGNFYRDNIETCNTSVVRFQDPIIQEPGDMSGPTIQGIQALIDQDPNTTWDTNCTCVTGSKFGNSPRVFPIPLYDPAYYANGVQNGRTADFRVANFLGFYADSVNGNQIYGRITNVVGLVDPNAGPAPAGAFPHAIRLVQ
jgi:Flp pilus assembly protein TadG